MRRIGLKPLNTVMDFLGLAYLIGAVGAFITAVTAAIVQVVVLLRQNKVISNNDESNKKIAEIHDLVSDQAEDIE